MTEEEFVNLWNLCSAEVADSYYPKGRHRYLNRRWRWRRGRYRGEYLRDQAVLCAKILTALKAMGVIRE